MREAIGKEDLRPLQTGLREQTAQSVQDAIQSTLDSYGAGIQVVRVNLSAVDPPPTVVDAFRDVQAAQTDSERYQNEATAYANQVIPEARGQAAQIREAAEAYRQQIIAQATGDADRFLQVYATYAQAPEIIRERIYLDTIAGILGNMNKIIVDDGAGGGSRAVPASRRAHTRSEHDGRQPMTRGRILTIGGLIVAGVLVIIASLSVYVVDPTKYALVLRFGDPVDTALEPGLYFKVPFIDNVVYIEKRLISFAPSAETTRNEANEIVAGRPTPHQRPRLRSLSRCRPAALLRSGRHRRHCQLALAGNSRRLGAQYSG